MYKIPCKNCDLLYIETTNQVLRKRLTQHKSDTRLKPRSTALAVHANTTNYVFDYDNVSKLYKDTNRDEINIRNTSHLNQ